MSDLLTVIASIRAKPGCEASTRELLLGLIGPTRAETGCIKYELHQSEDDPAGFVFYENWTSAAHLDAHAQSAHMQVFRKVAAEILEGPAEITKWRMVSSASKGVAR